MLSPLKDYVFHERRHRGNNLVDVFFVVLDAKFVCTGPRAFIIHTLLNYHNHVDQIESLGLSIVIQMNFLIVVVLAYMLVQRFTYKL